MQNKLRRFFFSVPVLVGAGLFALYLLLGFFALPPILKWQIEKQVPEQLGHRISVEEVRFNPLALRLEVGDLALSDPEGRPMLGFKRLLVDFDLRSLIDRAWTFANVTLEAPVLRFDLDKDGRHNFTALLARLRSKEPEKEAATLPRLIVMRAALTDGRIEFSDGLLAEPLVVRIEPLHIGIDDLSTLPAQTARYRISARTAAGETLEASGELALNPLAAKGKLALNGVKLTTLARGLSRLVALEPPAGTLAFATNFELAPDRRDAVSGAAGPADTRVELDQPKLSLTGARFGKGAAVLALRDVSIEGKHIAVKAGAAGFDVDITQPRAALADLQLHRATGDVSLRAAQLAGDKMSLAQAGGPLEVSGDGLSATLSDAVVGAAAGAAPLLQLGSATLSGGVLRLKDRIISADKLALANGAAQIALDAQGRLNWQSPFGPAPAPQPGTEKSPPTRAPAAAEVSRTASAAWRLALKSAQLDGFALAFTDARASPAFALGLEGMRARVGNFDTGSTTPMRVEFQAKVASGGQIEAKGGVRADMGMADLNIKLAGVALAPVQTYLSEFAKLRLAAGTASAAGRLRYNDAAGAGAKLAYQGRVSIDRLLLEEVEPKRPFLAWDSVATSDLVLTLQPNRADIGELRIDRPSGRLIIAADRTVNLTDVLKKRKARDGAGKAATSAPAGQRAAGDDPFPVSIARVRVAGGTFEFADLSLRPQFATRMHELKGVITGLSTDAKRSAKLQLDAGVDKYGSAKIRGQINVLHPEKLTDIDVAFRNLEMSSLSPYVAKFAGYRIAGGRLALDLEYKVRDGKLVGENKIVLNQVELGEKVDSPDALDLPIELALALLKDADGVINIGLPVSGDLGDPKFDYGALIGKAIGNLLSSIVTAPFRALGALFGGGSETLDTIAFEPGSDAIAPPERQKLEAVARALKERPALMLVVPPTSAPAQDSRALKSLAVRSDIVRGMGVELAPGENPGPIDSTNPRVQRAIEAVLSQRYAPEVLAALKARALEAAAPAAGGAPQSAKQPPPAFYEHLVARMIAEEPVSESALDSLATRRGAAIKRELTTAGGVPAARIVLGEPRAAAAANDNVVTLQMALEAAK
ncbi:MAG: DUF748 domain-containing protein [Burkholderiales bacterium]|nr:DUF748 domain-containing protein [Burkholderiales bacterium]